MKRMIKVLLILAATVAAVAALAITAGATELKTGIGIVEASGGLRLRSQASTSSDILSTAHNGDNVVVIRQVGNWYLVNYNLKIGYMHSDYITFKERENIELGYGSVDPYLANIRSGPSTSSGLVDQAGSGAKVFIFGFNCGWYKVKYNGQIGYIRSDLVTLLEKPYCNSGSSSSGSSYSSATGYDDSYSSGSSSSSSTSLGHADRESTACRSSVILTSTAALLPPALTAPALCSTSTASSATASTAPRPLSSQTATTSPMTA